VSGHIADQDENPSVFELLRVEVIAAEFGRAGRAVDRYSSIVPPVGKSFPGRYVLLRVQVLHDAVEGTGEITEFISFSGWDAIEMTFLDGMSPSRDPRSVSEIVAREGKPD
jgi:hypothetical protein